jgi:hypothetical protein
VDGAENLVKREAEEKFINEREKLFYATPEENFLKFFNEENGRLKESPVF